MILPTILSALLLGQSAAGVPLPEPREGNRVLPRKLRSLLFGLLVLHHPNPCRPVKEGAFYYWRHDTTVQSLGGDLTLVEYGAYLYTDAGWVLRATMTADEFAKTYRCPGARLRKGRVYTEGDNARRSEKPVPGDALWFFVAKDATGRLFKGTALIETEGP